MSAWYVKNVPVWERVLRIVVGLGGAVAAVLLLPGPMGWGVGAGEWGGLEAFAGKVVILCYTHPSFQWWRDMGTSIHCRFVHSLLVGGWGEPIYSGTL